MKIFINGEEYKKELKLVKTDKEYTYEGTAYQVYVEATSNSNQ